MQKGVGLLQCGPKGERYVDWRPLEFLRGRNGAEWGGVGFGLQRWWESVEMLVGWAVVVPCCYFAGERMGEAVPRLCVSYDRCSFIPQ